MCGLRFQVHCHVDYGPALLKPVESFKGIPP